MNNTKTDQSGSLERVDMRREILDYEIRSSWWAGWVWIAWLQDLTASYFARKVNRKYARWDASKAMSRRVKAHIKKVSDWVAEAEAALAHARNALEKAADEGLPWVQHNVWLAMHSLQEAIDSGPRHSATDKLCNSPGENS